PATPAKKTNIAPSHAALFTRTSRFMIKLVSHAFPGTARNAPSRRAISIHGAQNRKVPTHSGTRIPRPAAHGRAGPSVDTAPSDRASLENLEKVVVFWNGLFGYTVVLGVVPVIGRFCMASPDLDAPARVSHLTAAKFPCGSLRSCVSVLLAFSVALAAAMQCHAQEQTQQNQNQAQTQTQDPEQSVAEVARQERTRRQNQQRKGITTTAALRGISSSLRGRSRARLAQAADPALTSVCDRGSSHGRCTCSASGRSVAAVRQAVPLRTAARAACASCCSARVCSCTSCYLPRAGRPQRACHTASGAHRTVTAKLG